MRPITRLGFVLSFAVALVAAAATVSTAIAAPALPRVDIHRPNLIVGTSVNIEFSSTSENAASFECRLDNDDYEACTSPWQLTNLNAGGHTVRVRALTEGGAAGPADTVRFIVDAQGPVVRIVRPGSVTGPDVSISFSAFDITGIMRYECSLDESSFEICFSPVKLELSEGQHTFTVRATDSVGNTGPASSVTWNVDATPPDTTIILSPPNQTNSHSARFVFSAGEQPRTFECSLDDAPFTRCDSPKTYSNLSNGEHTFSVRAIDRAGNEDPTPAEATWHIGSPD